MKKLLKRNEFYVSVLIIILSMLVQAKSGQFFTITNCFDLLRTCILPGILSLGIMIQLIAGSVDVSFPSMTMLISYVVISTATEKGYDGSIFWLYVIAIAIGIVLGAINGILAAWLKLPTLIITLGTSSIYLGILQAVLKCRVYSILAQPVADLSKSYLAVATNPQTGMTSPLPSVFLILVGVVVLVTFMLRYTMLGRGIYAFGGDRVSSSRAGFNVVFTQIFVFAFMGALSGVAGITKVVLTGTLQPTNMIGYEMTCIAAAVLGGTRLSGGVGTVKGTLLGVLLMVMVSNNLILLGIPTYWSKFVTGILIIAGISISAYQALKSQDKLSSSILDVPEGGDGNGK